MARTTEVVKPKPRKARKPFVADSILTLGTTLRRFDPDEDFSDVDGDPSNEFALENEDPSRHYHWAHNSPDDIGQYKGGLLHYKVEHYEEGGVFARMHSEQVKGEAITKRDHVLVSCSKELWQKRNRYERAQTLKTNERMFRRVQRDTDLRDMESYQAEAASVRE